MKLILKANSPLVRFICACRGFGFIRVEACRVQYDTTTFVKVFVA